MYLILKNNKSIWFNIYHLIYRAADWNLGTPDWTGRMRLVVNKGECMMKLEDKITGELFAQSPIDKYPGVAIEAVTDSSRYFVVRIRDEGGETIYFYCHLYLNKLIRKLYILIKVSHLKFQVEPLSSD